MLPAALVMLAGVVAALMARAAAPVTSADTYFHLRLGDEFLQNWSASNPASVTPYASADWVPTQWLGQIIFAVMHDVLGLPGIAWLTGVLLAVYAACIYGTTRYYVSPMIATLLTAATVTGSFPALSGRPQVLSYAFVAILTATWLRHRASGGTPWRLIGLTWVWAMLHGMWIVGVVISAVAAVGILLDHAEMRRRPLPMIAVVVLSAASAALTPVGPQLLSAVVRVGGISGYFAEWAPPDFSRPSTAAAALLVAALVTLLFRSQDVTWFTVVMTLLACAWLAWSNRTVPVAAAMAAVLLAEQLSTRVARAAVRPFEKVNVTVIFAGALVILAFITPQTAAAPVDEGNAARVSVAALPADTGVLNEWSLGGADMWLHPHLAVVMHGYGDMFTTEELDRNVRIMDLERGWVDEIEELDVHDALLLRDSRLTYALIESLGWNVVAEDDGLVHLEAPEESR